METNLFRIGGAGAFPVSSSVSSLFPFSKNGD